MAFEIAGVRVHARFRDRMEEREDGKQPGTSDEKTKKVKKKPDKTKEVKEPKPKLPQLDSISYVFTVIDWKPSVAGHQSSSFDHDIRKRHLKAKL